MAIPDDKIVVVTGTPRVGSSWMMRVLLALGVPVAGDKFPMMEKFKRILKRAKKKGEEEYKEAKKNVRRQWKNSLKLNSKGYYEVPGVVMRGTKDIEQYKGKAIKIMAPGIAWRQNRRGMIGTPPKDVYKYILCIRDPRHVAQSQTNLNSHIDVVDTNDEHEEWANPKFNADPIRYIAENGSLMDWMVNQDQETIDKFLILDFDDSIYNPTNMIKQIVHHLDLDPTEKQLADAVALADPGKRRSPKEFIDWESHSLINGSIAYEVYNAFKNMDKDEMTAVALRAKERLEHIMLERQSRWYDSSIGVISNTELDQQMKENSNVREQLVKFYKQNIPAGLIFETDKSYEGVGDDSPDYTIKRPYDMGDLEKKMVMYNGEYMTEEAAYILHQRRWQEGETNLDVEKMESLLERLEK